MMSFMVLLVLLISPALQQPFDGITCDDKDKLPGHKPEQIHLSLGHEESSLTVMWITKEPTDNSMVSFFRGSCADENRTWKIMFGSSDTYGSFNGSVHTVKLRQLMLDSTYCYTVGDPCKGLSEERQFKTAHPNKMAFAALADTGTWGNVTVVLGNLEYDEEPNLVIHAGDLSYAQKDSVWDTFGYLAEPVASTRPYMIIPGNWDVKPFAVEAFLSRFSMPLVAPSSVEKISYYYSYNYSLVHFVMMSSYDPFDVDSEQYRWLEDDLRVASADKGNHPWIVISFHSPMYSSSVGHGGSDMNFRGIIEPLLHKYGVDLALSGHDHGYERTFPVYGGVPSTHDRKHYVNPSSTIHILAGTGGATSDEWLEKPVWTAHREASYGYTKVYATRSSMRVVYLRTDGTVGDEFSISKGSERMPIYSIMMVALVVFVVFPVCAYKGIPNKLFASWLTTPAPSNKSFEYLYKHV